MLKGIKVKNFRSFGNLEVNFTTKSQKPKKLIMIYGENGSGKSNLMGSILFLKKTLDTLSSQENFNKIYDEAEIDKLDNEILKELIKESRTSLASEIVKNKLIGSNENMVLEFDYLYANNKEAKYKMEFDDEKIIYESLYCQIEKNLVKTFEITTDKIYFNNNLFINEKYKKEIEEKVLKYFGKHSFLSIISNERVINNIKYMNLNVSKSFLKALAELHNCSLSYKQHNTEYSYISANKTLMVLKQGVISKKEKKTLLNIEESLSNYFSCLYSDIKGIHFELEENDNNIKYLLYFDKLINGKIRFVPYYLESMGTLKLLDIFPYIYNCLKSGTVFIDEIDTGVHDVLMKHILENLEKQIKGQLIITTHNTMLLQKMKADYSYVINVDINGNKTLNCIKDFGRIQNNHNVSTRYLNGIFGGVPQPGYMDFTDIMSNIEQEE